MQTNKFFSHSNEDRLIQSNMLSLSSLIKCLCGSKVMGLTVLFSFLFAARLLPTDISLKTAHILYAVLHKTSQNI